MKNTGISPAIIQEFVGHDSRAVREHYTHIELASLRTAADSIPHLEWWCVLVRRKYGRPVSLDFIWRATAFAFRLAE